MVPSPDLDSRRSDGLSGDSEYPQTFGLGPDAADRQVIRPEARPGHNPRLRIEGGAGTEEPAPAHDPVLGPAFPPPDLRRMSAAVRVYRLERRQTRDGVRIRQAELQHLVVVDSG